MRGRVKQNQGVEGLSVWFGATKRPVEILVRKVKSPREEIKTLEGTLIARPDRDFIIQGVKGEEYPIAQNIFWETYKTTQTTRDQLTLKEAS